MIINYSIFKNINGRISKTKNYIDTQPKPVGCLHLFATMPGNNHWTASFCQAHKLEAYWQRNQGFPQIEFHSMTRMGDQTMWFALVASPTFLWSNSQPHHFLDDRKPPNPIIAATSGSISGSSSAAFSFWETWWTISNHKRAG